MGREAGRSTACLYSSMYLRTLLTITIVVLEVPLCLTSFLLFQIPHTTIARTSSSAWLFSSFSTQKRSLKSFGFHEGLGDFTARKVHTSLERSQVQNVCSNISIDSHRPPSTSIRMWRSLRQVFVGIFLQAFQMKVLILFGHFRLQLDFHIVFMVEPSKHWPLS